MVVYDQECDNFDLDLIESLALTISMRQSCMALASFNADDDILWLGSAKTGSSPSGILLDENILKTPASFHQFRTLRACKAI